MIITWVCSHQLCLEICDSAELHVPYGIIEEYGSLLNGTIKHLLLHAHC